MSPPYIEKHESSQYFGVGIFPYYKQKQVTTYMNDHNHNNFT